MKKLFTLTFLFLSALVSNGQNIQGGMETWRDFTVAGEDLEAPNGWFGFDSLVIWKEDDSLGIVFTGQQLFQDSDIVHGGNYSAKIETTEIPGLITVPGIMSNAQPQFTTAGFDVDDPLGSVDFVGGLPVTERMAWVNAWIHYTSVDPLDEETGLFAVGAFLAGQGVNGTDSLVGSGELIVTDNAGFENMSVQVVYVDSTVVPDLIKVTFISSSDFSNAYSGTAMYIDDVTMSTTSVKGITAGTYKVRCYPNPTTGIINISTTSAETMKLQVYSLSGQVVATQKFNGSARADLSYLSNGMYFYSISNKAGEIVAQDKLVINK